MVRPTPVDLIILAGFLGSGKTTLLVDFLNWAATADTGVIVNEVGAIGVDGAIVADGADTIPLTLLANGCVCCSLRSSLVQTVNALLDAPRPPGAPPLRRIVLEASGLSRPGPIIASLADPELAARGLRVSVVTTYDCTAGAGQAEQFDEACAQFAAAQRIVLTKTDCVPGGQLDLHSLRAQALNPLAQILCQPARADLLRQAFADLASANADELAVQALRNSAAQGLCHPRIHVLKGVLQDGMSWDAFSEWLDDLAGLCGERLLRLKALVQVTDCAEPILIQSVGTTFSAPRRMMTGLSGQDVLILITRDMSEQDMLAMMPHAPVTLSALA